MLGASALSPDVVGAGQIWLDDVGCLGTEARLIDCPSNALGDHNCGHFEDAGVRCDNTGMIYSISLWEHKTLNLEPQFYSESWRMEYWITLILTPLCVSFRL